jgi:hypothetical protein
MKQDQDPNSFGISCPWCIALFIIIFLFFCVSCTGNSPSPAPQKPPSSPQAKPSPPVPPQAPPEKPRDNKVGPKSITNESASTSAGDNVHESSSPDSNKILPDDYELPLQTRDPGKMGKMGPGLDLLT